MDGHNGVTMTVLRKPRLEGAIQREIVDALERLGFLVIRLQSGLVRFRGSFIHLAPKGTPDLMVVGFGFLECKTARGKLNADQVAWHKRAAELGERVAVVRSGRQAIETVLMWRRDK